MSIQTINVGSSPNDGTGDPLRTGFQKVNSNFTNLKSDINGFEQAFTNEIDGIVVTHNLNRYPMVMVIDSGGIEQLVGVTHNSKNQIALTWEGSLSGTVTLR